MYWIPCFKYIWDARCIQSCTILYIQVYMLHVQKSTCNFGTISDFKLLYMKHDGPLHHFWILWGCPHNTSKLQPRAPNQNWYISKRILEVQFWFGCGKLHPRIMPTTIWDGVQKHVRMGSRSRAFGPPTCTSRAHGKSNVVNLLGELGAHTDTTGHRHYLHLKIDKNFQNRRSNLV